MQNIEKYVTRNVQNKVIEIKNLHGQLDVLLLSVNIKDLKEASNLLGKIVVLGHQLKYREG